MFDLEKRVRPNIRTLKPYHSARQDFEQGLLLDANENSLGAPGNDLNGLHRYPSPKQAELRGKIAEFRGMHPENVFVGNGSDEAIDLLYRIFCRPGTDHVLTTPPTYGMYTVSADIHDVGVETIELDEDFQPRVDAIMERTMENSKLLFLCSPNNPTGNVMDSDRIERLIRDFPGIVVVDEAYIDFSGQPGYAGKVNEYPNLVVLQTMSKSFGLAGIRLGIAFASTSIIDYLMKVKAPYNINALTSGAALRAFENKKRIETNIDRIIEERARLKKLLDGLDLVEHIYDSAANFLLVKMKHARKVYKQLAQQNIIVRYRGDEPGCDNCLRITVGTREENDTLINAIKQLPL